MSRGRSPAPAIPFRYPGTDPFYDDVGEVTEVLRYDRDCARISGRVWKPKGAAAGADLPGVIITTGSVQAPEPLYWWFAQALVRQGYVVMTWDVRGQGRSDTRTPDGGQGGNADPSVFWDGTVDAIDFFLSTAAEPYPHNPTCAATVPPPYALPAATASNPYAAVLDRGRLGLAGHSLGAAGVSRVQAMDPWEGSLASITTNPVDVIVVWYNLSADVVPRVPAMGQASEYGLFNVPNVEPPDVRAHLGGFDKVDRRRRAVSRSPSRDRPTTSWSLIPTTPVVNFSSTSWVDWGRPMAEHYSVAWMDRWLKTEGETGFADADARLLADAASLAPGTASTSGRPVRFLSGRERRRAPTTSEPGASPPAAVRRAPAPVRAPRPRWRLAWTPLATPSTLAATGDLDPVRRARRTPGGGGAGPPRRPALRRSGRAGQPRDAHHEVAVTHRRSAWSERLR